MFYISTLFSIIWNRCFCWLTVVLFALRQLDHKKSEQMLCLDLLENQINFLFLRKEKRKIVLTMGGYSLFLISSTNDILRMDKIPTISPLVFFHCIWKNIHPPMNPYTHVSNILTHPNPNPDYPGPVPSEREKVFRLRKQRDSHYLPQW